VASPPIADERRVRARNEAVIEREVKRLIARELHDRVAQTLTGMLVDVENFKTEEVGWSDVVQQLDRVQISTRQVLQNLRQLLHDLRGEQAIEDGFAGAVEDLAHRFSSDTGVSVEVSVSPYWPAALTRHAHLNLYRIVEEALTNVRMHSGARYVQIALQLYSQSELTLVVRDDGRGMDVHVSRPLGLGTLGMRERAMLLGGRLTLEGKAGFGTSVRAIFPAELLVPKVPLSTEIFTPSEVPA
jgi:two-component system, NarL family, sensor histidine kinase UhpB